MFIPADSNGLTLSDSLYKLIFKGSILGSAKEDQDTAASLILLLTPGNVDFITVRLYFISKLTDRGENGAS